EGHPLGRHLLGRGDGLLDRLGHHAALHRDAVLCEEVLGLVFVELHGRSEDREIGRSGEGRAGKATTAARTRPTACVSSPVLRVPADRLPDPVTRFDLHVLRRFFAATALLLGLLVVFFVVLDYVEYIDDFMDRGATMGQVFGTYY